MFVVQNNTMFIVVDYGMQETFYISINISACQGGFQSFVQAIEHELYNKRYPMIATDQTTRPVVKYRRQDDPDSWHSLKENNFESIRDNPHQSYVVGVLLEDTYPTVKETNFSDMYAGRNGPKSWKKMHECMQLLSARMHRLECIMQKGYPRFFP